MRSQPPPSRLFLLQPPCVQVARAQADMDDLDAKIGTLGEAIKVGASAFRPGLMHPVLLLYFAHTYAEQSLPAKMCPTHMRIHMCPNM